MIRTISLFLASYLITQPQRMSSCNYKVTKQLFFLVLLSISSFGLYAEGTKELMPDFNRKAAIQIFDNNDTRHSFATQIAPVEQRLHIRIRTVGEKIYIGLNQPNNDVFFQLKDPDGNIVMGPMAIPESGEEGYISSYNEAVAGPEEVVGASGYDALEYTTLKTGDYYIEFNPKGATYVDAATNVTRRVITYLDITVQDQPSGDIKLGRLWSQEWDITCYTFTNPYLATMYVYSDDGVVTDLDFNGIQPYDFTIGANPNGLGNSGNFVTDRQSNAGNTTFPQYKIFLNNPDSLEFPTGRFGSLTDDVTISGCDPSNRCINVPVDQAGSANIILDLNGVLGYQQNTIDRLFAVELDSGENCIPWDSRDGMGNLVGSGDPIPLQLDYFNGLTHLPLYDVENHPNGYSVGLVRPTGNRPNLFWDDSQLTDGTTDLTGCSDVGGCHSWDDNNPSFRWGDKVTINTWWYANILRDTAEFVNDTTIDVIGHFFDTTFDTKDTIVCKSDDSIPLEAEVFTSTGVTWSSIGGAGSFAPDEDQLAVVYTFGAGDKDLANLKFVVETTGNGACDAAFDTLNLRFQDIPVPTPGGNITACANNSAIAISGSVQNASGGIWSGGLGTYTPNDSSLNITYQPDSTEITAGSATLTLTTTGNGVCSPVGSNKTITLSPGPIVDAGSSIFQCIDDASISLAGTVTNATSGIWSGGLGSFSDSTNLNTVYTADPSEAIAGDSVVLTLTSQDPSCADVVDQITVTFTTPASAQAGEDQLVCESASNVQLDGNVAIAGGGSWSNGGGSFSPDENTLDAQYTPTQEERDAGSVELILTTTNNGSCNAQQDTILIAFTDQPEALAGNDQSICSNNALATLSGSSTNAGTTKWIGAGTFIPDATDLNADYVPTESEINSQVAALVLDAEGLGTCPGDKDTILIIISPAPSVNAGIDDTVCRNNPEATLVGSVTNASTQIWSGGAGTFNPNPPLVTNATYTPTQDEIDLGFVFLNLTAIRSKCENVVDTVRIVFSDPPTAEAGPLTSVCSNNADVVLNGTVVGATGGTWSNGLGSFSPDANDLNATYSPTQAEIDAGSMQLIMTTTGNGDCLATTDTLDIEFTPSPTAVAGDDITTCRNVLPDSLRGSFTVANGGTWSGGNNAFSPSANNASVLYTPNAADTAAGQVQLFFTTTDNINCNAVTDTVNIIFTEGPTVTTQGTISVCLDNPKAQLNGQVTFATGGTWTGGTGIFNPNDSTLNASYTPSPDEITARTVTLNLNTTGNQGCNFETGQVTINMTEIPEVDAGSDMVVCGNTDNVSLNGTIQNAGGGRWSTSGTGTFSPNDSTLNATYEPSTADVNADSIYLTLTSIQNGLCGAVEDSIQIKFQDAPSVDAGDAQTVCTNELPIQLNGSGSAATWSGGTGTFSPNASTLNAIYTPDATDSTNGSVTLTLSTIASGSCASITDNVTFTIPSGPSVIAGDNQTICTDDLSINLNGNIDFATGGIWTSTGNGSFAPDNQTLNTVYTATADDTTAGTISFILTSSGGTSCPDETDTVVVDFISKPTVFAGPDLTICADADTISLNGSVQSAGGGEWNSSGDGDFTDITDLTGGYIPSANDTTNGTVTLTLTSTDNGTCNAVNDELIIIFSPAPQITALADFTVCADTAFIPVSSSVNVATGGIWTSSGTGKFSPNNVQLAPNYFPSAADTANGSVTLYVESTGNGDCKITSDSVVIAITPAPTANAGTDFNICADSAGASLSGIVTIATGVSWTTSGLGTFNPDTTSLNTFYNLTNDDINAGFIAFTMTTTGNGLCKAVSDQVVATVGPAPTSNAGFDQTLCASVDSVQLNGTITIAGGGSWTTSGDGAFEDINSASTAYLPGSDDVTTGSAQLILSTTDNGNCKVSADTLELVFTPSPIVEAGDDQTVCADTNGITLAGQVTNSTGATWTGTGGSFFPNAGILNTSYVPTSDDISVGSVNLILTSNSGGPCSADSDTLEVVINPTPIVSAGDDITICADAGSVQLNGSITIATGGVWTTSGTGTFAPNDSTLDAVYTPSDLDTASGNISLTLTSTGNDLCQPVSDQLILKINPAPVASSGGNLTVCETENAIPLSGGFENAGGIKWTSSGKGIFTPNVNSAIANYLPSSEDIAAGTIQLTITTLDNGLCNAISETMDLTFSAISSVDAGQDSLICEDQGSIGLSASISNASGGAWSTTGNGTFFPNNTSANATYEPSSDDVTDSLVTLTFSTTGTGACPSQNGSFVLAIRPTPTVDAGIDLTVCEDFDNIQMEATITGADGAFWTTAGSGEFADSTAVDAIYGLSEDDIENEQVTLTITTAEAGSCLPVSDRVTIFIDRKPTVDAGPDRVVCPDTDTLEISGVITGGAGAFWETTGTGTFEPTANSIITNYIPSAADFTLDSISLRLHITETGSCIPIQDDMVLTFASILSIDAGDDTTQTCSSDFPVPLNGSGASGEWTGGIGTFTPSRGALNATYEPDASEIAGGVLLTLTSVSNGTCAAVSDSIRLEFPVGPVVSTGGNQTVCADTAEITLNASVTVAGGGIWSSTGTGTFQPDNQTIAATYIPSAKDIQDSVITITLKSTDNGICSEVIDKMTLTITPIPAISAGFDQSLCADRDSVQLNGSISIASKARWSSLGNGSFVPNDSTLNAIYLIGSDDSTSGSVQLVLSSIDHGLCNQISDTVELTITPAVTAQILSVPPVCEDNDNVQLDDSITVANGISWTSTGTGFFTPSATTNDPIYVFSDQDKINGSVDFGITTIDNSDCQAQSDAVSVTINPAPQISAGADFTVCTNSATAQLAGSVLIATGGRWTSNGTGTFAPNDSTLNATYTPSQQDLNGGAINLFITSTGNGQCSADVDFLTILVQEGPDVKANAGFDQTVCADAAQIQLSGAVESAGGGIWDTDGDGTFTPSTRILNSIYQPSANDTANGLVTFILTTTDNGVCQAATDTMELTITPAPSITAISDFTVCADVESVNISANVAIATGGNWVTTGSGSFVPNNNELTVNYLFSDADRTMDAIGYTVTSTGNGLCEAVTDFATVTITDAPTIDAGEDFAVCASNTSFSLEAKITVAGSVLWTTSGSGTFSDTTTTFTTYAPSAQDEANGQVRFFVQTNDAGTCLPLFDTVDVIISPRAQVNAGIDQTVCADLASVELSGSTQFAGGSIWSTTGSGSFDDASSENANYTPSALDKSNGTVTFYFMSDDSCTAELDSLILTILPIPVVTTSSEAICALDQVDILGTITNAGSGRWSTNGTGSFSPNTTTLNATYFPSTLDVNNVEVMLTLTSEDNGTCNAVRENLAMKLSPPPTANAGIDVTICRDASATLQATTSSNVTYTWLSSTGDSLSDQATFTVIVGNATSFTLLVEDQKGCTDRDTVDISVIDPPAFNLADQFCYDETLSLDSDPTPVPTVGTFQWYRNDTLLFSENNSTLAVELEGTHIIAYFFEKCQAFDTSEVTPLPIIALEDKIVCEGASTDIGANSYEGASYSWTLNGAAAGATDTITTIIADTSVFIVQLTDSLGCISTDSMTAFAVPPPALGLINTTGCADEDITLIGQPTNLDHPDEIYEWFLESVLLADSTDTIIVNTPGTYRVVYTLDECVSEATAEVTINPNPTTNADDEVVFCEDTDPSIAISAGAGDAYIWLEDSSTTQSFNAVSAGTYYVQVFNNLGCFRLDSVEVTSICGPQVFVPTAFAPGSSISEDNQFQVFGKYFQNFTITIFNRWGEIIFYSEDINESWDGTYRGELMPQGVYPYIVTYEGQLEASRGPHQIEGKVTLVK